MRFAHFTDMTLALVLELFDECFNFIFILVESIFEQDLLLTALSQIILESLQGQSLLLKLMIQVLDLLTMPLLHELFLLF